MKVGVAVYCTVCQQRKCPAGRSIYFTEGLCDPDCSGFTKEPLSGSLWSGETEEESEYPVGEYGWREDETRD